MNAAERTQRAKIAANERWAKEKDRSKGTESARRAFWERFLREVDPDGLLDPEERDRRARNARAAYYQRLALKSAQARRRKQ